MLKITKWLFYGFVFVFLWQISHRSGNGTDELNNTLFQLSSNLEESTAKLVNQETENLRQIQKEMAESMVQAGQRYINVIIKK